MSDYWIKRLKDNQFKPGTKKMDKEIAKVYKSAGSEIESIIKDLWLQLLQEGSLTSSGLYQYGRYNKLLEQINNQLKLLGNKEIEVMNAQLEDIYINTFKESCLKFDGILNNSMLRLDVVKEIVNSNFRGATFSQRIWTRQDKLKEQLLRVITNSAVLGKDYLKVSKDLSERLNVSLTYSKQLVRTETMRVFDDAYLNSAKSKGYTHYDILLGPNPCRKCIDVQSLGHYHIDNRVLPNHSNCECCPVIITT